MESYNKVYKAIYTALLHNKITIEDSEYKYSNTEFVEKSNILSSCLNKFISRGAKCMVLCDKNMNTAIAVLALWKLNAVPVIASRQYGDKRCREIYELTTPDAFITDSNKLLDGVDCDAFSMQSGRWIMTRSEDRETRNEPSLKDTVLIMCTSGTTGKPKGVMVGEEGLMTNIGDILEYFEIYEGETILIGRPLYHCAVFTGEFLVAIVKGLNIVFSDVGFQPQKIIDIIKNKNIRVMCGTPTLFYNMAHMLDMLHETVGLRVIAVSGECLTESAAVRIRSSFEDTGIYHVYGLTEAGPRVSYLQPELFDKYPQSVGVPLKSVEITVVDDNDMEVDNGIKGNVRVRGKNVMLGYYRNVAATEDVIKNGWLYTGDIGYVSDKGLLYIMGRKDDMIIKGGMNIYPKEIENQLLQCEEFRDILAYKIETDRGQRIGVKMVLENERLSKREVVKIISKLLPIYQYPDQVDVVGEIGRNASGKKVMIKP